MGEVLIAICAILGVSGVISVIAFIISDERLKRRILSEKRREQAKNEADRIYNSNAAANKEK